MKIISYILIFLTLTSINTFSQEGNYIRGGIIPYQLLSRSSGIYLGFDWKKFSIEYRPTITHSLGANPIPLVGGKDWFYFQGFNNHLLFQLRGEESFNVSWILGYRHWWYKNLTIAEEGDAHINSTTVYENKSSKISGPSFGFELAWDNSDSFFDNTFYIDILFNHFTGKTHVNYTLTAPKGSVISDKQFDRGYQRNTLCFAIGVKIGLRKLRNKKA